MTGNSRQKFTWITFSESIFSVNSDRKTQVNCTEAWCSDESNTAPYLGRTTPASCLVHGTPQAPALRLRGRNISVHADESCPSTPRLCWGGSAVRGRHSRSVVLGDDREETGHGAPSLWERGLGRGSGHASQAQIEDRHQPPLCSSLVRGKEILQTWSQSSVKPSVSCRMLHSRPQRG